MGYEDIELPTEPGLYQATIRVPSSVAEGIIAHRPMARIGIDFDGRWFEYRDGRARVIRVEDIIPETFRVVDWSTSPEIRKPEPRLRSYVKLHRHILSEKV